MEFWQGQSHPYSNYGSVPRRSCPQNFHERYQASHYPLHYGELQDGGRESGYFTVAGSGTGGAPQKCNSWMDQELTTPAPPCFPFIAAPDTQQYQDSGEDQQHEVRAKEWMPAQRGTRGYESGFLREGWPRRWEACNPVPYNRDVSAKTTDGSYRELEAWAARYSHSLPRRGQTEAELRGSSQGLLESSRALERDNRSGTDPREAALQQIIRSATANIIESGLCNRGGRQQALASYASQTPNTSISRMLDMKEKTCYRRTMLGHPPGYVAPPPYNSPHKISPVLQYIDTSSENERRRQAYWSQPTLATQNVSLDPGKGDKEDLTKPDVTQHTSPELQGLKNQRHEMDVVEENSPVRFQKLHMQHEGTLSLQGPQALLTAPSQKKNTEPKIIEGRKFRLGKKTGGLTVFCLVSRIAGTTATPSLPLYASQTDTEAGSFSKGIRDCSDKNQSFKLADEVDYGAVTPSEQSNIADVGHLKVSQQDTQICKEKEISNKAETVMFPKKAGRNGADRREVSQPGSVKYPLWREPSFTSGTETESSSTSLKANSEEGESEVVKNEDVSAEIHPTDAEARTAEMKTDTKPDDSKDLLVIDTTCVVVKMELIPSPEKKQVHYFDHSPLDTQPNISPDCVQTNRLLKQEVKSDQNKEIKCIDERSDAELDSDPAEKKPTDEASEISSASGSGKEALDAEEVLGIPEVCSTTEQESGSSLLDLCAEDLESPPIDEGVIETAAQEISEDRQSQIHVELDQTEEDVWTRKPEDNVSSDSGEDFSASEVKISTLSDENNIDSQLKTPIPNTIDSFNIAMRKDLDRRSTGVEGRTEENLDKNHTVESYSCSQHPSECPSPPASLSDTASFLHSQKCEAPDPALLLMPPFPEPLSLLCISDSNIGGPQPEDLTHYASPLSIPHTPSEQTSSPPTGLNNSSHSATTHTDQSPDPSPLDLINVPADTGADQDDLDVTEELVLEQLFESGNKDNPASVTERNVSGEYETNESNEDLAEQIMEQVPVNSQDDSTMVKNWNQIECVQELNVTCVIQKSVAEDQLPKEANKDPKGLMKATISQETLTECQTDADIYQQQFDNSPEDASSPEEKHTTEEPSDEEANEDAANLMEEARSRENTTDSQTQIKTENFLDTKRQSEPFNSPPSSPSDSPCVASQSALDVLLLSEPPSQPSSRNSDVELASFSETESDGPSALGPVSDDDDDAFAAATIETVLSSVHLNSCEGSCLSSSISGLSIDSIPTFTEAVLQEDGGYVSPDMTLKEEPHYPKSLWDAVNRIRKHTAPDSESEEEEASDQWELVGAGEDFSCPDVDNIEKRFFHEAEQHKLLLEGNVEDAAVGKIQEDSCGDESMGDADEDSMSCSSTSSQSSEDTVIRADEFEEMTPDAGGETKSDQNEESHLAEGEGW